MIECNIFEHNDLSNMREEKFEDSIIYYMDDFYKYPDKVLEWLLKNQPSLHKENEHPSYNGIYFEDRRHVIQTDYLQVLTSNLESVLNQKVFYKNLLLTNFTKFRISEFNDYQNNFWWPHKDVGYTCLIYFNDFKDEFAGTNLYKKVSEKPIDESIPEHFQPWQPKTDWEIIYTMNSKFNRFVAFDGLKYYHNMNIFDDRFFYDVYRMNQVLFFS